MHVAVWCMVVLYLVYGVVYLCMTVDRDASFNTQGLPVYLWFPTLVIMLVLMVLGWPMVWLARNTN